MEEKKQLKKVFDNYTIIRSRLDQLTKLIESMSAEYEELHEKLINNRKAEKELINKIEEVEGKTLSQYDLLEIVSTDEN
jgi:hypothetical protein